MGVGEYGIGLGLAEGIILIAFEIVGCSMVGLFVTGYRVGYIATGCLVVGLSPVDVSNLLLSR